MINFILLHTISFNFHSFHLEKDVIFLEFLIKVIRRFYLLQNSKDKPFSPNTQINNPCLICKKKYKLYESTSLKYYGKSHLLSLELVKFLSNSFLTFETLYRIFTDFSFFSFSFGILCTYYFLVIF